MISLYTPSVGVPALRDIDVRNFEIHLDVVVTVIHVLSGPPDTLASCPQAVPPEYYATLGGIGADS
jgi:hypothetical protein